jgi:hypothetical protein
VTFGSGTRETRRSVAATPQPGPRESLEWAGTDAEQTKDETRSTRDIVLFIVARLMCSLGLDTSNCLMEWCLIQLRLDLVPRSI